MTCIYTTRLNHLWSIWYCIFVCALQGYLVFLGIERYKLYADLKWPMGEYPKIWLTVYGVLHAVSVCLVPIFIATSAFKTGNLGSDNDRLGARPERTVQHTDTVDCCSAKCKSFWQHAPPVAQCIHCMMAFTVLMAQQLMLAVMYRADFINRGGDNMWSTELDIIFRRGHVLAGNLPSDVTGGHRIAARQFEPALRSQAIAVRLVPLLTNQHLFGLPLEFVNYLLALLTLVIVWPSVFWRVSQWFSCIFSLHLMFHALNAVFAYVGFSLLFRVQLTGVRTFLGAADAPFLLHNHYILLGVYLGACCVAFFAGLCVYGYGYNKFYTCWAAKRSRWMHLSANGKPSMDTSMTRSMMHGNAASLLCCEGYGPHIAAIGMLVIMVLIKAPIMYDLMVLYQHQSKVILFTCIIADVVYLFWWIILWLALTLKRDWNFHVLHSVPELICLLQADRQPGLKASEQDRPKPSELANALLLVHGDEAFYTIDDQVKINILRQAQKYGVCPAREDAYWLRNSTNQSPTTRRQLAATMADKQSPETSRLLPDAVVLDQDNTTTITRMPPTYHTLDRSQRVEDPYGSTQMVLSSQSSSQTQQTAHHRQQPSVASSYTEFGGQRAVRSTDPVSTFGTLPRGGAVHSRGLTNLVETVDYDDSRTDQQVSYASIHKQQSQAVYSQGGGQIDTYSTLGQYARPGPPQARILAVGGQNSRDQTGSTQQQYSSSTNTQQQQHNNYSYLPNTLTDVRHSPGTNRHQQQQQQRQQQHLMQQQQQQHQYPTTTPYNNTNNVNNNNSVAMDNLYGSSIASSRQSSMSRGGGGQGSSGVPGGGRHHHFISFNNAHSNPGSAQQSVTGSLPDPHPVTTTSATSTFLPAPGSGTSGSLRSPGSELDQVSTGGGSTASSREETPVAQQQQQQRGYGINGGYGGSDATLTAPQQWMTATAHATAIYTTTGSNQTTPSVVSGDSINLMYNGVDTTPTGTLTSQASSYTFKQQYQNAMGSDNYNNTKQQQQQQQHHATTADNNSNNSFNGNRAKATLTVRYPDHSNDSANFSLTSSESGHTVQGQHPHATTGAQFATSCV